VEVLSLLVVVVYPVMRDRLPDHWAAILGIEVAQVNQYIELDQL